MTFGERLAVGAVVAGLVLVLAGAYSGHLWYLAFCTSGPMTFSDVDLNHDNRVGFTEADYVCNCGVRTVVQDGKECTEYFAYKDGLPLKTVCPGT